MRACPLQHQHGRTVLPHSFTSHVAMPCDPRPPCNSLKTHKLVLRNLSIAHTALRMGDNELRTPGPARPAGPLLPTQIPSQDCPGHAGTAQVVLSIPHSHNFSGQGPSLGKKSFSVLPLLLQHLSSLPNPSSQECRLQSQPSVIRRPFLLISPVLGYNLCLLQLHCDSLPAGTTSSYADIICAFRCTRANLSKTVRLYCN